MMIQTIFRIEDYIKRQRSVQYYRQYLASLKMSADELEGLRTRKLKELIKHADTIPFYQKRFADAGFDPEKLKSVDDLKKIPVVTRQDIQNSLSDMKDRNYKGRFIHGSSSGSTGVPVHYYHDSNAASAGKAAGWIVWNIGGWELEDKGLQIWGNPSIVNNEWKKPSSRLKAWLLKQHRYPAYSITQDNKFTELYELIRRKKYVFLNGYTNAIYLLARYMKENELSLPDVSYVLPTGETLQDYQRCEIEKWIGPVRDIYGCGEINGIAAQCKICGHYHIIDPHVIVEYADTSLYGNIHNLFITDLDNYSMPLIRYENGDSASRGSDSRCIIPFSTMGKIEGRTSDVITFPNGGALSVPSFFGSVLLKQITCIKQYQVIKETSDQLIIKLALIGEMTRQERQLLENNLIEYLQSQISWSIQIVDKIDVSNTGKHKIVIDKTLSP